MIFVAFVTSIRVFSISFDFVLVSTQLLQTAVALLTPCFFLQENYTHMKQQVDNLRSLTDKIVQGGPDKLKARHRERGKLLARERIDALIDAEYVVEPVS